jgi:fluoride exporter
VPDAAQPRTALRRMSPVQARGRGSGPRLADIAAVAIGGGVGSVLRYLLSQAFPPGHGFPWAIFAVNVSGCFALGLLMVYLLDVWRPRRLLRPLLGVGLLGGYTTFSTYTSGVVLLIRAHALALADAYALTSVVAGLAAVWCGAASARRLATVHRRRPAGQSEPDTDAGADGPPRPEGRPR